MRSQLSSLGIASFMAACLFSSSSHANVGGIVGRSGKQQGQTCMMSGCHGDSPSANAPTVELTGPTSLAAGETGNYTLTITGGPAVKGGMNVAVSNNGGTLNAAGADLQKAGNELTHKEPKAFSGNQVTFDFSLVAPSTAGTVTIFANGNSTNGDGTNAGDNAQADTLSVQITGGTGNPDGGTGNPDGGTGNPGDGEDDGGCAAAGGPPLVLLIALVAAYSRRRRA